jgi:hypothetical protein
VLAGRSGFEDRAGGVAVNAVVRHCPQHELHLASRPGGGGRCATCGSRQLVIFAVDVEAAGQVLRAGRLTCPECGGALRVWARARTRRVHAPGGRHVELTPDRGLCRGCGTSHVVVPAWYVPRRAYTVEMIGAVLLGGASRTPRAALAERLGVPAATAAGWLRGVRRRAVSLIGHAIDVGGPAVGAGRSPASPGWAVTWPKRSTRSVTPPGRSPRPRSACRRWPLPLDAPASTTCA